MLISKCFPLSDPTTAIGFLVYKRSYHWAYSLLAIEFWDLGSDLYLLRFLMLSYLPWVWHRRIT